MPFANCQGLELFYLDVTLPPAEGSDGSARPPLLLVHGWPASAHYWGNVHDGLAAGRRVIAVDLKGFGRSDKPDTSKYEIVDMADDLARFLDSLSLDRVDVMGHSMGGMISLALTVRHPDRVGKLVAVSAPVHGPDAVFPSLRPATWPGLRHILYPFMKWKALTRFTSKRFTAGTPVPEAVIQDLGRSTFRSALTSQISMQTTNLLDSLAGISHDVLLIYGERDQVIMPVQPLYTLARLPRSRLLVMPGVGHCPSLEAPATFLELTLPFLNESTDPVAGREEAGLDQVSIGGTPESATGDPTGAHCH